MPTESAISHPAGLESCTRINISIGAKKGSRERICAREELASRETVIRKGMMIRKVIGEERAWASSWLEHIAPTAA